MRSLTWAVSAVVCAAAVLVPATAAQATTKYCRTSGDGRTGVCYSTGPVALHSTVVEAVPLVNNSSRTVTAHCSFSQTITKAVATTVSVSTDVKAHLFALVDASTKIEVSRSITQTAAQATTAGGSVVLKPHTRITCERTYGYVVSTVTRSEWSGTRHWTKKFSVSVPSRLGVTFVD